MVDEIRATSSLRFFTRARYEEISDDYAWPPCLTTDACQDAKLFIPETYDDIPHAVAATGEPHPTRKASACVKRNESKKCRPQESQSYKEQQHRPQTFASPFIPFLGGTPFGGAREAPPGFRPLPMMQAMLEFAAPIMAYVENKTVQDPNDALQIGMQLWNSTLPKVPVAQKSSRTEIVDHIRTTLQMDMPEAEAFFDHMIERKAYLFPDEIQPEGALMMFMRKEVDYLITQFEESQLQLSDEPIPPEREDHMFLDALRRLDAYCSRPTMMTEEDFFTMQEICCNRYHHWLQAKGA